ncbi:MAG TPA: DUF695 domain-containing protein [Bacteroidia bacterium]|nr:DUF695 domain-containing protein [Bacteroidia bacterium]
MGLFDKIFGKSNDTPDWNDVPSWEDIKGTEKVYPKSALQLFSLRTKNGFAMGWVDKAYINYPYKKYCKFNFLIKVHIKDVQTLSVFDLGAIQDFFSTELRKICVAHSVARIMMDYGLNIEMYLEKEEEALEHLKTLASKPDLGFKFGTESANDPTWVAVKGLMELK